MRSLTEKLTHARNEIEECLRKMRDKQKVDDGELECLRQKLADAVEEVQLVLTSWSLRNYDDDDF